MSFWRGETLEIRLRTLVSPESAFDPKKIDCAAYTLTLGSEIFITSELSETDGAQDGVKVTLRPGQQFRIVPGQFAFLVSQETIAVPNNAIAFISMKATYKLRGLINVSGFHVDPGWNNPLLFSVYNAGPSPVCLTQGMPLFLIWYANLDGETEKTYKGKGKAIDGDLISSMSGEVFSPIALRKEVGRLRDQFRNATDGVVKVTASLDSISKFYSRVGLTVAGLLIAGIAYLFKDLHDAKLEMAKLQGQVSSSAAKREVVDSGVPRISGKPIDTVPTQAASPGRAESTVESRDKKDEKKETAKKDAKETKK